MTDHLSKIVVLDTGYEHYRYEKEVLARAGYTLHIFTGDPSDRRAKMDYASAAAGVFVRWTRVDKTFLEHCRNLKAVVRYGTGYENIDLEAATKTGVKVANVGGYGNHSVSDHALSLIYACIRGLFPGTAGLKVHFGKPPFERIFELHRKTLGIIGLGRIGGTLAGKATALFKRVLASDPYIPDSRFSELRVDKTSLESLLRESDVISIHCNLTGETTHLLDRQAFEAMERKPYVINTARGPVIKTAALLEALVKGFIQGVGLDVFDSEIPEEIDERILSHPHIIATGHYAWYSENSMAELQKRAAQNMVALLAGRTIEDGLQS